MTGVVDLRGKRLLAAALVATALCLVFSTRVFVSFDGLRVKLVKTPIAAAAGQVRVQTASDARAAVLSAPVALIAVLHNTGLSQEVFSIVADSQPVCEVRVPARSTVRADCVVARSWSPGPEHTLVVTGVADNWALDFLEVATHHGSSSRLLSFLVLPDVASAYQRPGPVAVAAVWILLCLILVVRPVETWSPRAVWVHRLVSGGLVVMVGAMVVSPWVSPFLLVMPAGSFAKVAILLLARRLWRIGAGVAGGVEWAARHQTRWRPGVAVAAVAVVVAGAYGMVMRYSAREFDGNFTGLLRISAAGFDRSPLLAGRADVRATLALLPHEGYDGQFMYFAVFDPLLRRFRDDPVQYRTVVDAAPYRFGRIGFPWLVRAVAGSRWNWYPTVMMGLVLLGTAASAAAVARLAQLSGMSGLWGLIVLAVPGFWQSVRVVLPEPLAAAALLLGYLCVLHRRIGLAVVLLASSLLIRETGLVFIVALLAFMPGSTFAGRDRWWLAMSAAPLVLWRLYLAARLWPDWGWDGLFFNSHNVAVPLLGVMRVWTAVWTGAYHPLVPELARAAAWFPIVLALVAATAVALRRHASRALGVALIVYAAMALSFTFPTVWGHVANAERASYEVFVLLAMVSVCGHAFSRGQRAALVACWIASALFVLYGAHDALGTREALFPWG